MSTHVFSNSPLLLQNVWSLRALHKFPGLALTTAPTHSVGMPGLRKEERGPWETGKFSWSTNTDENVRTSAVGRARCGGQVATWRKTLQVTLCPRSLPRGEPGVAVSTPLSQEPILAGGRRRVAGVWGRGKQAAQQALCKQLAWPSPGYETLAGSWSPGPHWVEDSSLRRSRPLHHPPQVQESPGSQTCQPSLPDVFPQQIPGSGRGVA